MYNIPKMNLFGHIEAAKINDGINMPSTKVNSLEKTQETSFKNVFGNLVQNVNADLEKPDALLADLMSGKPNVDIHDVMAAMSKAELGVSIASQLTTKIINAYDRISQMQI